MGADLAMYRKPRLYDIAFGFRDIAAECRGLLQLARRHGVPAPKSAIELACGPAHHLRELARRGMRCTGIDINAEMLAYAAALCRRNHVRVELRRGDMRTFHLTRRADLVLCLFDSFAQCATERDAIETLRASARALKRGGLLIVEFTHPADYFGRGRSRTSERWTQRDGDTSVRTRFSITRCDPVAETFIASMTIEPVGRNGKRPHRNERLEMRWLQHMWMRGGFQYVALASGAFEIVGWYGDIDPVMALTDPQAWRMIAVLRKR
ncbi:MAG: class I SAM-dependent methyltransferase [Candidatus Eremiobacteraeota bacterium]|nr:class I SAM-dependent methyltransferase [Candidatus Eremiobacteraeota bacterium]